MRAASLLSAAAVLLAACGVPEMGGPTATEASADQVTYRMNLKMTEEGALKADLYADTAITKNGESRTFLSNVKLTYYNPAPQPPTKLTSKKGEYDPQSGLMVARQNVVLIVPGDKGLRTIKSEELYWDQRNDRVWSERETSVTEEGKTFWTKGFTSDSRFTNVTGSHGRSSGVRVGEGGIRF